MPLEHIEVHIDLAQQRLPDWLQSATNLNGLIEVLAGRFQQLEDSNWLLFTKRSIFTAVGDSLDIYGEILNLPRQGGESDSSYRIRLLGATAQLSISGTAPELIQVYKIVATAIGQVQIIIYDQYPIATAQMTAVITKPDIYTGIWFTFDNFTGADSGSLGPDTFYDLGIGMSASILKSMGLVRAGGIQLILQVVDVSANPNYFRLGDVSTVDINGNNVSQPYGLGDYLDPTIGGNLAELLGIS